MRSVKSKHENVSRACSNRKTAVTGDIEQMVLVRCVLSYSFEMLIWKFFRFCTLLAAKLMFNCDMRRGLSNVMPPSSPTHSPNFLLL